ncbi:probable disease resistance RPP8-like protein 2 [Salvia miltiorrhiza]|uniref:probable disease resistance RPP8-like protein 2 n=1 Tax=Salvia miltiorrhiza TaxID=226208 RepID=UPI0025ACBF58|nr:probable disease resistance RPP8-like protein 2 [Salvia miltiorrhiza]
MQGDSSDGAASEVEPLQRKKSENPVMAHFRKIIPIHSKSKNSREKKGGPEQKSGSERSTSGSEDVDVLHEKIRTELLNPSPKCSEVFVVGESGMGKTTLARKLIEDRQIKERFNFTQLVPINQNFQIKKVLQFLVRQLDAPQQQLEEMNEIQLIHHIFDQLKNKIYLIVFDDVATLDDWESIRLALPLANSNRVIITTSSTQFHQHNCYKISGLSQSQILSLLRNQPAFKLPDSEKIGEAIFRISGGSPLYAEILGKSLESEVATANKEELLLELDSYAHQKGKPQVLGASYKRLAPELKPCLLYIGQFPEGDIEVEKLYLLLLAENLVLSKETFENHLEKLAGLKFVAVQEDIVSVARLHDRVREFCILQGLDEEFFQVVESWEEVRDHTRRLAMHLSNKCNAESSTVLYTANKILSLLIFGTSDEEKSEIIELTEFSHMRILSFDDVSFKARRFPKGMDKLVLLRYLSFRGCLLEELPSSLSHLTQLETLDLLVRPDCKMLIPNSILTNWKRMVHLYLPRLYYHSKGKSKLQLKAMESLEILVNFDTEVCDIDALSNLKKLRTLSTICTGDSQQLNDVIEFLNKGLLQHSCMDIKSFDCYNSGSVSALKKLLSCRFLHSIKIEGQIVDLIPEEDEARADKLAEIVLYGSQLEHDPMGYLGKFQNLRSLVLSNDALLGDQIVISADTTLFPELRSLKLHNLHYLKKIAIQNGAMPKLSALQIEGCDCSLELSIPKEVYDRLKQKNGGDAQSVMALPYKLNINVTS